VDGEPPNGPRRPPPTLGAKRAVKIFVVFNLVQILIGTLAAIPSVMATVIHAAASGEAPGDSYIPVGPGTVVLVALVSTVLAALVALRMTRRTLPGSIRSNALSSIGWSRTSTSQAAMTAALGAAVALLYMLVLVRLFPPAADRALGPLGEAIKSGGWPLRVWALSALIAAPIEEFVYRGVLFSGLSRSWGRPWAGLFATVVFVFAHLLEVRTYWPALLSVTSVATALVLLLIRSNSLVPGVLCHAAYNAVVAAAVVGSAG